ncbi:MAG TPA: tetratricopeptide repeat protein [Chitinophagales bacterium]|nr:tetratricopeptide repeat protein [Chitinophagales bacterium]
MLIRAFFLSAVALASGCNLFNNSSEEKSLEEVKKAEAALYGDDKSFKFEESKAREVITSYDDFVAKYPKSKHAPEILLKSADLHRALKDYEVALRIYERIEKEYPDYEKMPQVIFLQGFVNENELYRLEKAKERYEFFLSKYPDHELADDVKFSLQNLGKSPEEIIKQFEQQSQTPVDSVPS